MWIPFQATTLQKSRTSGPKVPLPPPHWERGHPRPRPAGSPYRRCPLLESSPSSTLVNDPPSPQLCRR